MTRNFQFEPGRSMALVSRLSVSRMVKDWTGRKAEDHERQIPNSNWEYFSPSVLSIGAFPLCVIGPAANLRE